MLCPSQRPNLERADRGGDCHHCSGGDLMKPTSPHPTLMPRTFFTSTALAIALATIPAAAQTASVASARFAVEVAELMPIGLAPEGPGQAAQLQQLQQFLVDPRVTPERVRLTHGLAIDLDQLSSNVPNPRARAADRAGFSEGLSHNLADLATDAGYPAAAVLYRAEADYYAQQVAAVGCPCD